MLFLATLRLMIVFKRPIATRMDSDLIGTARSGTEAAARLAIKASLADEVTGLSMLTSGRPCLLRDTAEITSLPGQATAEIGVRCLC